MNLSFLWFILFLLFFVCITHEEYFERHLCDIQADTLCDALVAFTGVGSYSRNHIISSITKELLENRNMNALSTNQCFNILHSNTLFQEMNVENHWLVEGTPQFSLYFMYLSKRYFFFTVSLFAAMLLLIIVLLA